MYQVLPELLTSWYFIMAGGDTWEEWVKAGGERVPLCGSFPFPTVRDREGGGDPCTELRGEV